MKINLATRSTSDTKQHSLTALQNHKWRETGLHSCSNAFHTILYHDASQLTEVLDDKGGVYIRFRTDGSMSNLRRLQAHKTPKEKLIRELLFADDAALVAQTESAMQRITSCFAEAAQLFGLEVSLKKTEVFHQPAPQEEYHPPRTQHRTESELKAVHQFSYL